MEPIEWIFMIVMLVASAATTAISIENQNEYADSVEEQSKIAAALDKGLTASKQTDINDQAAQEKLQRELQAERERGRISVAMGESGVTGNSGLAEMSNAAFQGMYDTSIIETNRKGLIRDTLSGSMQTEATLQSRLLSAESSKTGGTMAALQIGSSAAEGASSGYKLGGALSDASSTSTTKKTKPD